MTIGLSKGTTRCSMLPDGGEAKQEREDGTENPISGNGFGIPAVVFGRRSMRRVSLRVSLAGGLRVSEVRLQQRGIQNRGLSALRVRGMQTSDFGHSRDRHARHEDAFAGVVQRCVSGNHTYSWFFRASVSTSAWDQNIGNRIPDVA